MKKLNYDIVIIGGGCAGMAAALAAKEAGTDSILIIERSPYMGGVLRQCIHNGFGIHKFGEDLTGTEYAARLLDQTKAASIEYLTDTIVLDIHNDHTVTAMNTGNLLKIQSQAIILATGCRERPRGALAIPGARPAGIMTAGTAQRYMNLEGYLVGKKIVILGSGDIGLIMARQFVLEGAEVLAVAELQPYSSGLTRNIVQCIEDFSIPLYFNTTVSRIEGDGRLTGVWLAEVDENKQILSETERYIACDSLILSVGLIPENELAAQADITMDPITGGPLVNDTYQTNIPGIFACGNSLHVHDLADFVTLESEAAGKNAALYVQGKLVSKEKTFAVENGFGVRGAVPQQIQMSAETDLVKIQFRPTAKYRNSYICAYCGDEIIYKKKHLILTPGEMCELKIERNKITSNVKVQVEL